MFICLFLFIFVYLHGVGALGWHLLRFSLFGLVFWWHLLIGLLQQTASAANGSWLEFTEKRIMELDSNNSNNGDEVSQSTPSSTQAGPVNLPEMMSAFKT